LDALDRVATGGSALDPEVVAQLLARSRHPLDGLTPREREVLSLMAEGRSNSAIADALVGAAARWKSTSTTSSPSSGWRPATATTVASWPCCATWAPDERGDAITIVTGPSAGTRSEEHTSEL